MGAGDKQRDTSKNQPKYIGNVVLKLWCFSKFVLVLTVPIATCPSPAYLGSRTCCLCEESVKGASLELQAGLCLYRMVAKQRGWCWARFAPAIWRNPGVCVVISPQPWALEGELWRGKPSPRSCWQHAHKFVLSRRRLAHSSKLHSFSAQEVAVYFWCAQFCQGQCLLYSWFWFWELCACSNRWLGLLCYSGLCTEPTARPLLTPFQRFVPVILLIAVFGLLPVFLIDQGDLSSCLYP